MSPLMLIVLVSCTGGDEPEPVSPPAAAPAPVEAAPAPSPAEPALADAMKNHWTTATAARDRVLHGDLAGARLIARGLADEGQPEGLPAELEPHHTAMRVAADKLASATSTDEAGPAVGALALTCAQCHSFAGGGPREVKLPLPPPEIADPTRDMAVHLWALDWMWVGLVSNDPAAWDRGAKGLEHAPFSKREDLPRSELGLAQIEKLVHLLPSVAEGADRDEQALRFGETLAVCAMCHGEVQKAGIKPAPSIEKPDEE